MDLHHQLVHHLNETYENALATGVYVESTLTEDETQEQRNQGDWRSTYRDRLKLGPLGNPYTVRSHLRKSFAAIRRPLIRVYTFRNWHYDHQNKWYRRGNWQAWVKVPAPKYMDPVVSTLLLVGERHSFRNRYTKPIDNTPVTYDRRPSLWEFCFYGDEGRRIYEHWLNVRLKEEDCLKALKIIPRR
jgi:hypothetical protein